MRFITETPTKEMWNQIRYLKSPMNVQNILSGKIKSKRNQIHDTKEIPEVSYEISSCIQQADEYYRAAETVGLATKPLLQFYGAQSLCKAVIISNTPHKRLKDIQYHGLSTRAKGANDSNMQKIIQDYRNDPEKWNIEDEFAITNDGVFPDLCKSINETIPIKGAVIKFKELIKIIPDLSNLYELHYSKTSHAFKIYSGPKVNKSKKLEIYFYKDLSKIKSLFPELCDLNNFKESKLHKTQNNGFISCNKMDSLPNFGAIETDRIGVQKYLIRPLECGIKKSLVVLFTGLFILSNVVRYKPAFWMEQVEGKSSGSASIVESFCNLAERKLPNDVLESIWHEEVRFDNGGSFY